MIGSAVALVLFFFDSHVFSSSSSSSSSSSLTFFFSSLALSSFYSLYSSWFSTFSNTSLFKFHFFTGCGSVKGNTLRSPGYPSNYPSNMNCVYRVDIPFDQELLIIFSFFQLESHFLCMWVQNNYAINFGEKKSIQWIRIFFFYFL